MVTIHVDDSWLMKDLGLFIDPVEIHDATGKLLGIFVPGNLEQCKAKQAEILAEVDWAEIDRRAKEFRPGEPLEKTLVRLKKLEEELERCKAEGKPLSNDEAMAYFRSLREQQPPANGPATPSAATQEAGACPTP